MAPLHHQVSPPAVAPGENSFYGSGSPPAPELDGSSKSRVPLWFHLKGRAEAIYHDGMMTFVVGVAPCCDFSPSRGMTGTAFFRRKVWASTWPVAIKLWAEIWAIPCFSAPWALWICYEDGAEDV